MTDPVAAREKLIEHIGHHEDCASWAIAVDLACNCAAPTIADSILSAGFVHLGAPTEDVMDGVADILIEYDADMRVKDADGFRDKLAAFVTAHAALERESVWKEAEAICQRVAVDQDNNHGLVNTGGAEECLAAIRKRRAP